MVPYLLMLQEFDAHKYNTYYNVFEPAVNAISGFNTMDAAPLISA